MGKILYLENLFATKRYDAFFSAISDGVSAIGDEEFTLLRYQFDLDLDGYFYIDLLHNRSGMHILIQNAGPDHFTVLIIDKARQRTALQSIYPFGREIKSENAAEAMRCLQAYLEWKEKK